MDQNRFDQLTRTLGAGRSRRGALKALLGGALGGAAAVLGAGTTDAATAAKSPKPDCCPSASPKLCGLTCTNTITDPNHCGGCGAACPAGQTCSAGHCVAKSNGQSCTLDTECASGHCADGVCCNAVCGGGCQSCNQPGHLGACTSTSTPVASHGGCASDGSVCKGTCNGVSGACTYPSAATTCRAASCANGTATLMAHCDGAGHCPAATTVICDPYICGPTACASSCAGDPGCAADGYCDLSVNPGVCRQDLANGVACARDAQCASNHCVNGACCDSVCVGATPGGCQTCATGTCGAVSAGAPCTGGVCDGNGTCVACVDATNCPTRANASATCVGGICGFTCNAGFADCNGDPSDGCEVDLTSNVNHCGDCTTACGPTATCDNGLCNTPATCFDGFKNEGETDIDCGGPNCPPCASGKTCLQGPDCQSGLCCGAGVCVDSSNSNCGACGNVCSGGMGCVSGSCQCPPNQTNCGGTCADTLTDANNCGSCAHVCPSGQICQSGACVATTKGNGQPCVSGTECTSTHCADGVCCDAACTGVCQACSAAKTGGINGICAPVLDGTDPNNACADQGAASCGTNGFCQGGACAFYPNGTACTGGLCDGNGSCVSTNCSGGCLIANVCYQSGAVNPSNPCQVCVPANSTSNWTNEPNGTSCPGGTCQAGTCAAACTSSGQPCTPAMAFLCCSSVCLSNGTCQ